MKVMAINSSARTGKGSKTQLMLDNLVQGMRQAGAQVEVVNLREKKINYCIGCFTCWSKTPGVCVHQDDMTSQIYPAWLEADLCVYATPLYHYTVNAQLKTFIERTLPMLEPFMVPGKDGATSHPLRHQPPAAVFLSVAGFPEASVFAELSHYVNSLWGRHGALKGEIYRAGAESMQLPCYSLVLDQILEATRQAGAQLVTQGKIEPETMSIITQPLDRVSTIQRAANMFWRTAIAHELSPRQFAQKGLTPKPDDLEDFLAIMSVGFNPKKAADAQAVIQFDFNGPGAGCCHLAVEQGKISGAQGPAEQPSLTVKVSLEDWCQAMGDPEKVGQLFMSGKAKADGDLSFLMKMGQLFGE